MKSVGIFICNYNKQDFVINCVQSLLNQAFKDFDLYVVDNASTDDSVAKLNETFRNKIKIIENKENLGGSGGFNTGIRYGHQAGYEYIMLVDNDTVFDINAVGELYNFLENNKDVGMVGSKIYYMKNPEFIQEFGGRIDFKEYRANGIDKDSKDIDNQKIVQECDYLAACSLMVRKEVIDKIGDMDESCFIYWDDTDFGYRCKLAGYKCSAISSSKVWHNGSLVTQNNLGFTNYYFWRNKFNFFSKYILETDIKSFAKNSLKEIYRRIVGYYCKKQYDMSNILVYALLDFFYGIRGKAEELKTKRQSVINLEPFYEIISDNKEIFVEKKEECSNLESFVNKCLEINNNIHISINKNDLTRCELEKLENKILIKDKPEGQIIFSLYEHVANEKECILPKICVDNYFNCIYDKESYSLYSNYDINENMFVHNYEKIFIDRVKKIRGEK